MKTIYQKSEKSGFSLVELSIVLVILGLLTGGILSGQSLIRAAELRSVTTEYERYTTAVGTFREKYFGLPGDLSNAESFWTSGTKNGDGNGQIKGSAPDTADTNETSHFWAQLAKAGLIEGNYTPSKWSTNTAGTTNPKARLNSANWNIRYVGIVGQDDTVVGTTGDATQIAFEGNYGNAFFLISGTNLSAPAGGVMKAEEAWNIDTKMDDGKPALGNVGSLESQGSATAGAGCSDKAPKKDVDLTGSAYSVTNTSATACSLVFKTGW